MTNPDNAGGLPELLPCPHCGGESETCHEPGYGWMVRCMCCSKQFFQPNEAQAVDNWNRRELCRAAPAGGECTLGVGDGSGQLFVHGSYEAIKACQALILRDSAPAGSGEVERMAKRLDDAREIEEETSGLEDTIDAMRTAAALLRKLQQGTDKAPEGFALVELSVIPEAACIKGDTIVKLCRQMGFDDQTTANMVYTEMLLAASRGQEGGK